MSDSVPTETVAKAAQVHASTISRWVALGLLPKPEIVFRGKRGKQTRWPRHAPEQAAWVRGRLDAGLTFDEIRAELERGVFRPQSSSEEPNEPKSGS